MLRVHSTWPEELDDLVHKTIGCCIAVHRVLGPGLLEEIYARALGLELTAAGIPFQREKAHARCAQASRALDQFQRSRAERWPTRKVS